MSEITKLYKNAGIDYEERYNNCTLNKEGECKLKCSCDICKYSEEKYIYPSFTAGKQLEIENIIFQCNFGVCELVRTMPAEFTEDNKFVKHYFAWQYHAGDIGYYNETVENSYGDWDVEYCNPDRKEALAGFVNGLWNEHLTEEERNEIRNILRKD